MAGMTDAGENAVLNAFFRGTSLTALGTVYIGLYKTSPAADDASDGVEQDYLGYARLAVVANTSNWKDPAAATQGQTSNSIKLVWPVANAAGSNTTGVFMSDSPSGGVIYFVATGLNVPVAALDQPYIDIDQLIFAIS